MNDKTKCCRFSKCGGMVMSGSCCVQIGSFWCVTTDTNIDTCRSIGSKIGRAIVVTYCFAEPLAGAVRFNNVATWNVLDSFVPCLACPASSTLSQDSEKLHS